eukprot:TCONS_00034928-protein
MSPKIMSLGSPTEQGQEVRIKALESKIKRLQSENNQLKLQFKLFECGTTNGHFVWKIDSLKRRFTEAKSGVTKALHSAPCFTDKYGYKYCLRLHPDGDGLGARDYLSLYFILMKSEYDNIQTWPFQKKIQLSLINQQDRCNDLVECITPDADSPCFKKPINDMNLPHGLPKFIEIDRLVDEGFVKDDCLFIEIKIEDE